MFQTRHCSGPRFDADLLLCTSLDSSPGRLPTGQINEPTDYWHCEDFMLEYYAAIDIWIPSLVAILLLLMTAYSVSFYGRVSCFIIHGCRLTERVVERSLHVDECLLWENRSWGLKIWILSDTLSIYASMYFLFQLCSTSITHATVSHAQCSAHVRIQCVLPKCFKLQCQ